jgi:hypothetical protein
MTLKINDLKEFMKEFADYEEISDKILSYKIGERFGISQYTQRSIKKSLEDFGFIKGKCIGVWFKLSAAENDGVINDA